MCADCCNLVPHVIGSTGNAPSSTIRVPLIANTGFAIYWLFPIDDEIILIWISPYVLAVLIIIQFADQPARGIQATEYTRHFVHKADGILLSSMKDATSPRSYSFLVHCDEPHDRLKLLLIGMYVYKVQLLLKPRRKLSKVKQPQS